MDIEYALRQQCWRENSATEENRMAAKKKAKKKR
jgi:hypothetical protein